MDLLAFLGTYLVLIIIASGLLALIPAFIAREKGRSFAVFWALGFFATVIVGLIAVLAMPPLSVEERIQRGIAGGTRSNPNMLKCPYCAEFIKAEAKICKNCGRDVAKEFKDTLRTLARIAEERKVDEMLVNERVEQSRRAKKNAQKAAVIAFAKNPRRVIPIFLVVVVVVAGGGVAFTWAKKEIPVATMLYCNFTTSSSDVVLAEVNNLQVPAAPLNSEGFRCLSSTLLGVESFTPRRGLEIAGYRFVTIACDYQSVVLDRCPWAFYRQ